MLDFDAVYTSPNLGYADAKMFTNYILCNYTNNYTCTFLQNYKSRNCCFHCIFEKQNSFFIGIIATDQGSFVWQSMSLATTPVLPWKTSAVYSSYFFLFYSFKRKSNFFFFFFQYKGGKSLSLQALIHQHLIIPH